MTKNKLFQSHFRKGKGAKFTGHPTYVFDEDGNKYKVLGVTHAEKTNGIPNIKLAKNPEPNNTNIAYIKTKVDKEEKNKFGARLKGWKLSNEDKPRVKAIIESNNQKKD